MKKVKIGVIGYGYVGTAFHNFFKSHYDGYTIFVTEDKNIPDSFVESADLFIAETFINSYTLDGIAEADYCQ